MQICEYLLCDKAPWTLFGSTYSIHHYNQPNDPFTEVVKDCPSSFISISLATESRSSDISSSDPYHINLKPKLALDDSFPITVVQISETWSSGLNPSYTEFFLE